MEGSQSNVCDRRRPKSQIASVYSLSHRCRSVWPVEGWAGLGWAGLGLGGSGGGRKGTAALGSELLLALVKKGVAVWKEARRGAVGGGVEGAGE